ncbi:hypothetical protein L204_105573 [Cryptococcus depauperatus]|nr:endoplasmic reticulum protein [Cryptococcus depauperatus CBS 7855]
MIFTQLFARRSLRALSVASVGTPRLAQRAFSTAQPLRMVVSQVRYNVANRKVASHWAKNPIISYEELKPITEQPSDDILLVDVREPDEAALGTIPSAVNLPLSRLKDSLNPNFNPGDFQREFAFTKPLPQQNIIFYCRSGKRSATAAEIANENGYKNVRNYIGSWLDWSKRDSGDEDDY